MKLRIPAVLILVAVAFATAAPAPADPAADEVPPFGFSDLRVRKIDGNASIVQSADFDGDGVEDLITVNNAKARFDLFLSRPAGVEKPAEDDEREKNELPPDLYAERREILTEKEVTAYVLDDFNGDGRVDLAFYGKPKELVVAFGDGTGGFDERRKFPIADGAEHRAALAAGDLNGDGRSDLVLLLEKQTAVLFQKADGGLGEPVREPRSVEKTSGVLVADLDGDGRKDLVLVAPEHPQPVRIRLQEEGGTLGAEIGLDLPPFRSLAVADLAARPGEEILAIQRSSGLFRMLALTSKEADADEAHALGTIRLHPFDEDKSGKPRRVALGDVDGDGRTDVVATAPGSAQVALYRQDDEGRLGPRRLFPSLSEAEDVLVADFDADGEADVVVLSGKEDAVGVSRLDEEGRLVFPQSLPIAGKPRAMAAGDMDGDGKPEVVVVTKGDAWHARIFGAGEPRVVELAGLDAKKDDADGLRLLDVNQDGRTDLLLFDRYRMMRAFVATAEGSFTNAAASPDYAGALVEKKTVGDVAAADLTGDGTPELLVASPNFARALVLEGGRLTVKDQVNARSSSSRIQAVAAADIDRDGRPEVLFLDADGNMLTVLGRTETGVYEPTLNLPLGESGLDRLEVADLDSDGGLDIVVMGRDRFGVLYSGGARYELEEIGGFESASKDGYLWSFTTGDLNADGKPDLAIVDARNNMVEMKSVAAEGAFAHELKWRVYEQKLHEGGRMMGEPRELYVADVTGDGRKDLVALIHDRMLIYPQDE